MAERKLKPGSRAKVYQMWMTREDPEGNAKLLEFIGQETGMPGGAERWWVSFPDEGDEGPYFRTVWPQDKTE